MGSDALVVQTLLCIPTYCVFRLCLWDMFRLIPMSVGYVPSYSYVFGIVFPLD